MKFNKWLAMALICIFLIGVLGIMGCVEQSTKKNKETKTVEARMEKIERHIENIINNNIKPVYNKGDKVIYLGRGSMYIITTVSYDYAEGKFTYTIQGEDIFMKQVNSEDLISLDTLDTYRKMYIEKDKNENKTIY